MKKKLQIILLLILLTFSSAKIFAQTAAFTFTPQNGCAPLTVQFTDQSTGATSWLWDFGNGFASALQNPSVVYFTQGTFIITLSINGGASIASDTIVVDSLAMSPDTIFGTPISCLGTGDVAVFYAYPPEDSANYVWTVPQGSVILTSSGSSIRVFWGGTAGVITVGVVNDCGTVLLPYFDSELIGMDTSITLNTGTLTSNALYCSYQWIECPAMTVLAGDTNKTFTPLVSGSYAVIVKMEDCVDTSNCWDVIATGVFSPELNESGLTIFPNPTTNTFTIKNISPGEASIQIINSMVEVVYSDNLFGKNEYLVEKTFAKGIYCVRVNDVVRKLIVE